MKKKKILCIVLAIVVAAAAVSAVSVAVIKPWQINDSHFEDASEELINPNATPEAKELMSYLRENYGKKIISGQYVNEYENFSAPRFRKDVNDENSPSTVFKSCEMQVIHDVTGKYPAILGFDLSGLEYGAEFCRSIEQAEEWAKAGGIVTLCWHWNADNMDGKSRNFYTEDTDFDLGKALADKDSDLYKGLIKDIDIISEGLGELQDAGVPVLWRPLHEASGGWFWWGASGSEAYKELWDIIYDRMTNYHHLNNLIWISNSQDPEWYVGDDKCDIIGDDVYCNERENYMKDPSAYNRFKYGLKSSDNKMITMSENDFVPDAETAFKKNAVWSYFCTWCREFVVDFEKDANGEKIPERPIYSAKSNTSEELAKIYNDERVITFDDLPFRK